MKLNIERVIVKIRAGAVNRREGVPYAPRLVSH